MSYLSSHSEFGSLDVFSGSKSAFPEIPSWLRAEADKYIWELLHHCDHHESDADGLSSYGLDLLKSELDPATNDALSVGSPDWVFLCDDWDPEFSSAIIHRDSKLIGALQRKSDQLKFTSYDFLSGRLIEGLFELGIEARHEQELGATFWKRAQTVTWRHGLGTLGYSLEFLGAKTSRKADSLQNIQLRDELANRALPHSFAARQFRILYKYG